MTTSDEMDDAEFPGYVADRLSSVPGVRAVALGGSRAAGTQRPDRDLDEVEWHLAEAIEGRFRIERLLFHLAGVPTYIVVAELAVSVVLYGGLPSPGGYPDRLRQTAHERWLADARRTLGYARGAYAGRGRLTETAGAIALAFAQGAHATLAARGEWITNEKTLLDRAGFRRADEVLGGLTADPPSLVAAVDAASDLIGEAAG